MKDATYTLKNLYEELFPNIGLTIEDNNSISCIKNNKKELILCNRKPLLLDTCMNSKGDYVLFNLYSEKVNCAYYILERHIQNTFSSKINLLFTYSIKFLEKEDFFNKYSKEIHPLILKLYENDLDIENINYENILDKWKKIYKVINEQPYQDILIKFNLVNNMAVIDKPKEYDEVEYEGHVIYFSLHPFINITFPLYELLKDTERDKLLGINLSNKDIKLFKIIYEYLFEGIEKGNSYIYPSNEQLKDVLKEMEGKINAVYTEPTSLSKPFLLLKSFIQIANSIDFTLNYFVFIDKFKIENEMFNLLLSEEVLDNLEKLNVLSDDRYRFDLQKELNNHKPIDAKSLDERLNKEIIEKKEFTFTGSVKKRYKNYRPRQTKTYSIVEPPIVNSFEIFNTEVILDPNKQDFNELIPPKERLKHTYILGATGAGKSEVIKTLIYSDIKDIESSIVLLEPHGDLASEVAKMVKDKNRLIIIDPYMCKEKIPTINPFEIKNKDEETISIMTQELVSAFETGIGLEWSHNMEAVLAPCISTLLRKENTDIYELQKFMDDNKNDDLVELGKKSPIKGHRDFFNSQFKKEKLDVTKDAIATKLQTLLNDSVFANLITGKSSIDLEKQINTKGKVIIFKLTKGKMKNTLSLYSRLIMATIQGIVLRRQNIEEQLRPRTNLYLDEFQNFIGSTIEEILTESRKYKLFVTFAHQTISQLDRNIKGIVLSNTNIKIVGRNSNDNLKIMGKELQTDIDKLENLEEGVFFLKVGVKEAIKIRNTDKFIGNKAAIDDEIWKEHLQYQLENYYKDIKDENEKQEEAKQKAQVLKPFTEDF